MFDTIQRVENLARRRGMSMLSLAQKAGLNHTTLYRAKYKNQQLKLNTIEQLCRTMGITLAEFFDPSGEYRRGNREPFGEEPELPVHEGELMYDDGIPGDDGVMFNSEAPEYEIRAAGD